MGHFTSFDNASPREGQHVPPPRDVFAGPWSALLRISRCYLMVGESRSASFPPSPDDGALHNYSRSWSRKNCTYSGRIFPLPHRLGRAGNAGETGPPGDGPLGASEARCRAGARGRAASTASDNSCSPPGLAIAAIRVMCPRIARIAPNSPPPPLRSWDFSM